MPVRKNRIVKRIYFEYENDVTPDYVLQAELHETDEFGPTISILNLEVGAISIPLSFFTDAIEYLQADGAIPKTPSVVLNRNNSSQNTSSVAAFNSKLAPTKVVSRNQASQNEIENLHTNTNPEYYANPLSVVASSGNEELSTFLKPTDKVHKLAQSAEQQDLEDEDGDSSESIDEAIKVLQEKKKKQNLALDPEFTLKNAQKKKKTTKSVKKVYRIGDTAEGDEDGDGEE